MLRPGQQAPAASTASEATRPAANTWQQKLFAPSQWGTFTGGYDKLRDGSRPRKAPEEKERERQAAALAAAQALAGALHAHACACCIGPLLGGVLSACWQVLTGCSWLQDIHAVAVLR